MSAKAEPRDYTDGYVKRFMAMTYQRQLGELRVLTAICRAQQNTTEGQQPPTDNSAASSDGAVSPEAAAQLSISPDE